MLPKALGVWLVFALAAVPGAATPLPPADASDGLFAASVIRHVDMRAAALLMSGQRGGAIDGVLTVGAPEAVNGMFRVPFWIELGRSTAAATDGADRWVLDVFVYALDDQQEVESFEGRGLQLDLGATRQPKSGVRLHGSVEVSSTVRTLRVLARDQESGEFYLDEGRVPLSSEDSGVAGSLIVFPGTGEGWHEVAPPDWSFESTHVPGFEIAGVHYIPQGRPVIAAPSELDFFVVATLPEGEFSTIDGSLWNDRGMEVDPGDLVLVGSLPTATKGQIAYGLRWRVPGLDPGRYLLELSLAGSSGDPVTEEIAVIAVPLATVSEHSTWVTFADAPSRRTMPRASAAELAYLDALGLCASGRWNECVEGVFEIEDRAIREDGGTKPPSNLLGLEGSGINNLVEHSPSSMIPLLAVHHDVFRAWAAAGDPVGQRHGVRLIAAMARDISKRPSLAPATSAAVAVLASVGDTLHQLGVFDGANMVFDLALELDPTHQASLLGTAADHEWLGHYQETVEVLRNLGQRADSLFEARLRLGVNLLRTGRHTDATTELRACTGRGAPAWVRAVAYQELALYNLDDGRPEDAKALIEEATEALPKDITLRLMSAYIEETRGNLGEARLVLSRLDERALSSYRESPRKRYARWPSEVFAQQRHVIDELATKHLDDLAAAVAAAAAQPDTRGP
jgi:tetratricopeptide (TPR) repeat protein